MDQSKAYGLFEPREFTWVHGIYLTLYECKNWLVVRKDIKDCYVIAKHTKECLEENRIMSHLRCCIGSPPGIIEEPATDEEIKYLIKILEL